ncbi:hypothetical protein BDW66DRAFT_155559 [Aspergillus desertorum]
MQLMCIIQNLEQWIIDNFRPWISRCVSLHDDEYNLKTESKEGDDTISDEEKWEPTRREGGDVDDTDQSGDDKEDKARKVGLGLYPIGNLMQEMMQGVNRLSVDHSPKHGIR